MTKCELAIGVDSGDSIGMTNWYVREFDFVFVPRAGEEIWIGETIDLIVAAIEHGFMDDSPPVVRVVVEMDKKRFDANREFLKSWGFSGC